jgi:K+-transporting ATPase KdpF subunit
VLGAHEGVRETLNPTEKDSTMDYLLAGFCAVLLFFYLIYALLKPERF